MSAMRKALVLRRRPHGEPERDDFQMVETPLPEPKEGQVLTRTIWLSIDPYMRGRLYDRPSYAAPVQLGGVMDRARASARWWPRRHPASRPATWWWAAAGGRRIRCQAPRQLVKLDRHGPPLSTFLGVLGMPGVTAYSGMTDVGRVKHGRDGGGVGGVRRRSARSPGSSPSAPARAWSASPAGRRSACGCRRRWASTTASIIAAWISTRRCGRPARTGSMSISRMSAGRRRRR